MSPEIVNYIGYAGSLFVVISFMLKEVNRIRLVNLMGCLLFVAYGFANDPILWPVIIPNGLLSFVQIYHLVKSRFSTVG